MKDPTSDAHIVAYQKLVYQRRWEEAVAACERAAALDPNNAEAIRYLGLALALAGRPEGIFDAANRALRIDPACVY